jgi:hypothetical protein
MVIGKLRIGTYLLLTASPIVYPAISAAVDAISRWYR